MVHLGRSATAEEAALCVARSPEGQAAAKRAAPAAPQLSEEESKDAVPPMPSGAFVKEEDVQPDAVVKEEGAVFHPHAVRRFREDRDRRQGGGGLW